MRSVGREEALAMLGGFSSGQSVDDRVDDLLVAFSDQDLAALAACLRDVVDAMDDWEFSSVMPLEVHEAEAAAAELEALSSDGSPGHAGSWRLDMVRARYLDWSAVAASADAEPGQDESWFRVSVRDYRSISTSVHHATKRDPAIVAPSASPRVADLAVREALDKALDDIGRHASQMSYHETRTRGAVVHASCEISTGHPAEEAARRLEGLFPRSDTHTPAARTSEGQRRRLIAKWFAHALARQGADPIKVSWSVAAHEIGSVVRLELSCTDRDYLARKSLAEVFARCEEKQATVRLLLRQP
ncbi:hypothetical protein [Frigoribacterium sp. CFBP 13707]|uniref:hypothetical protein n=1 Tax=Frigoribacterium sp. CFBP 13707 TaxID=2775313 RepID=UPI001786F0C8|nr:hypothetical protein [Frigoribacterium sp. CFBP 13707]MBD8729381.1 hypothetical protein [Frigoribacterium sp. CFBP 13707]